MSNNGRQIEQRAYQLWEQNGSPGGRDAEFWYQAERELSSGSDLDNADEGLQPLHIAEHMQVISADYKVVGNVDGMDGADTIKLTKASSPGGQTHHYIPVTWVDRVDQHVHLNKTGEDVVRYWKLEPDGAHFPNALRND
jgi:hypothetical protein